MTDYPMPPTPDGVDEFDWRAAVSAVRGYCGWHIAPSVTETVTVDGPGRGMLLLPTLHLTAVTNVINDGESIPDPDKLQWSERGAVRQYCHYWTTKWRGVTLDITHGYDDFPHELLAVARGLAKMAAAIGVKSMASGPHTVQFDDQDFTPLQRMALDRYRIGGRP